MAGLAHHPLQQVWSGEATTKSLVTGVGLGLVGVVTKPLSGAAELVALTGQGLLQGAGWNPLPTVNSNNRYLPVLTISHFTLMMIFVHFYSHGKDQLCNTLLAITVHPCDIPGACHLCSIIVTTASFM